MILPLLNVAYYIALQTVLHFASSSELLLSTQTPAASPQSWFTRNNATNYPEWGLFVHLLFGETALFLHVACIDSLALWAPALTTDFGHKELSPRVHCWQHQRQQNSLSFSAIKS